MSISQVIERKSKNKLTGAREDIEAHSSKRSGLRGGCERGPVSNGIISGYKRGVKVIFESVGSRVETHVRREDRCST